MSIGIIDIINIEDIATGLPSRLTPMKKISSAFSIACPLAGARGGQRGAERECKCFHLRLEKFQA
jgi:hypothetical protein